MTEVLFPIFGQEHYSPHYATELLERTDDKTEGTGVRSIKSIGKLDIGIEPLYLFDVTVDHRVRMERNRVQIQRVVRRLMGYYSCAFILFHYPAPQQDTDWRFSYCHKAGRETEGTDTKRYTFLLGPGQSCRTAAENFATLAERRGHIDHADIERAFSVEALTREFYAELLGWYDWARDPETGVTFPNDVTHPDDDREGLDLKLIRLITRLMFVWFIKEKGLVPERLFRPEALTKILKAFDPQAVDSGQYYQAILQNLFFATLNREIVDESGRPNRTFAERVGKRDIKTLYRYDELFAIPKDEVVSLFAEVPFLNGGLFECLDKTKELDGEEVACNIDGFSRNDARFASGVPKYRAFVPNALFFAQKSDGVKHEGLFSILSRYHFTVEENTPSDQQVALDPELLGKVFENLLGTYNPDTQESARKQKGAFYTPREVVSYMVDQSLRAALGEETPLVKVLFDEQGDLAVFPAPERTALATKLRSLKILDPACGSGAFPMGMLNRMVDLLQRLEPTSDLYALKLELIENCIYGIDIEPIAVQITKLRFFISLVCDCDRRSPQAADNYGLPPLPNLETKFVAANTLIRPKREDDVFRNQRVEVFKQQLKSLRHAHFRARTASEKKRLRAQDHELCEQLRSALSTVWASEEASQLVSWSPYDQNASAPFFDAEWMFDLREGFDVVIGNPPYVQLQKMRAQSDELKQQGYATFDRMGDLYVLFYERGCELLKPSGTLTFITSNKWMRAGYGGKLRKFLAEKTQPDLLIDFGGLQVFDSATVDVNILLAKKQQRTAPTRCVTVDKEGMEEAGGLKSYVLHRATSQSLPDAGASWVVLGDALEESILEKIARYGTPLGEWDVRIFRGVLTGCNEAFIISTAQRDRILDSCATATEREKTAQLIRPILRGRDIRRWRAEWADLWLIATFPSLHYEIDDFPAVRDHLLSFGRERLEQTGATHTVNNQLVKARKKTHNRWFEMQDSIAYWNDFMKPKIVYIEIMSGGKNAAFPAFTYDEKGHVVMNTGYIMSSDTENLYYLLGVLNSKVGKFIIHHHVIQLGESGYRVLAQYVTKFPIVHHPPQEKPITDLVGQLLAAPTPEKERALNALVCEAYGLTDQEREYIEAL